MRFKIGITFVLFLIIAINVVNILQTKELKGLKDRVKVLESEDTREKTCWEYTVREFRDGNAPEKCAAEVYGDQF